MSVINQMLKDLDERNPEQNSNVTQAAHVSTSQSSIKLIAVTTLCVLTFCFVGFYIWQLVSENQALKAEQANTSRADVQSIVSTNASEAEAGSNGREELAQIPSIQEKVEPKQSELKSIENKTTKAVNEESKRAALQQQSSYATRESATLVAKASNDNDKNQQKLFTAQLYDTKKAKTVSESQSTKVTPAPKAESITTDEEHGHRHPHVQTSKPKVAATVKSQANKMSVSRRQLSADELAQQKLTLAEKALAAKQVDKAEKLLEDVIIIKPSDSQTRKKLAALWFGRQAYQDALNLLSQGIALDSKDASLRELKARIHLQQGQVRAAVNTLKPLANLEDEQYQIMLANTAQQAQQNDIAINAYQMLIAMQPDLGRWQLGLAVLYDKNSQFDLASKAYKSALTKSDLSISSEKFVKQRIQVIGQ